MRSDELTARAARAPFYRERADTPFSRLPVTRRDELLRDQLANLPFGTRRLSEAAPPVRLGVTGTGDALLVLAWSAADLARERAAGTRLLARVGVAPGMRVANTLPGALVTPGSLLLGDVVEELDALDVPLGAVEDERSARQAWELVDRVQPEVIVLEAPEPFLGAAPRAPRRWWRGIVWLQRGARPTPQVPAATGFEGWQRRWLAVPEATSFVASSCAASRFHVDESVYAEVVDERTGAALPPGREGTLALSVVDVDAPVLRYASGIAACMSAEPCPCGAGAALEIGDA
jgi:phenylacetate-coenzyme A ligase PaaK-like adenylate-forming protein